MPTLSSITSWLGCCVGAAALAHAAAPAAAAGAGAGAANRAAAPDSAELATSATTTTDGDDVQPWFNTSLPFEDRARLLVAAMSDAEVFNQTTKEAAAVPRLGVPQYSYWCEAAHGVAGAGLATVFPASIMRGAAMDVESERAMATMIAQEARAIHADRVLSRNVSDDLHSITAYAPVVNVLRDGRWGRAQETYGEDPALAGVLGRAFVEGLQANASAPGTKYLYVSAMAKHFAAYNLESDFIGGGTDGNFRLQFDANVSTADLFQSYTPQFTALVQRGGAATVMCSYQAMGGIPMCAHPLLRSFLRERLGFDGPVFSDGGAVHYIFSRHNYTADLPHAAAAAMNAGVDLNSGGSGSDFGYHYLPQAVAAGLTNMSRVRQAVTRLMLLRLRLGMFDPPGDVPFASPPMSVVASAPHAAVARTLAVRGTVLLRNDNDTLPLDLNATARIAVVGPNADRPAALLSSYAGCREPWDGAITPACNLVTPLRGLEEAAAAAPQGVAVEYVQGCGLNSTVPGGVAAAQAAVRGATAVVVVLGLSTDGAGNEVEFEGEAHDRTTLALPPAQDALLRGVCAAAAGTATRVVVVLMNGGPVAAAFAATDPCVHALLEAWYPGQAGGSALADLLFGAASPSGRLPVTVPVGDGQLAADYYDLSLAAGPHGRTYRYYNNTAASPMLYSFGFGLSYASFEYSDLVATVAGGRLNVSARVANTAGPCADEVAQLYVALRVGGPAERFTGARALPLLELKAFRRVAGLCAGGPARTVAASLDLDADLRLVDADGSYDVIPGTYDVWFGGRAPGSVGMGGAAAARGAAAGAGDGGSGRGGVPAAPLHAVVEIAASHVR